VTFVGDGKGSWKAGTAKWSPLRRKGRRGEAFVSDGSGSWRRTQRNGHHTGEKDGVGAFVIQTQGTLNNQPPLGSRAHPL
jgi:hypothetical protein